MEPSSVTIQTKAIEQNFISCHLYYSLKGECKLYLKLVDETLVCDHSNEFYLLISPFM